jgi:hypothetical protein
MSNQLTHSEFLAHIKKHGATKTRITEDWGIVLAEGNKLDFRVEDLRKYSTRNYYPPFEGEIKGFNQSIIKKTMSIINNAFKSKENKAMEKFELGTTDQLNSRGRDEFIDYLFQNLPEQKKGFLEKIVAAFEESKK